MATKKTTTKKKATRNKQVSKKTETAQPAKKVSLINAAVQVLGEAKAPMNCKQIVQQVMDKGLWTSDAPTPHATLYSAILREIQAKGDGARFRKVDRGSFSLTPAA